jgi:hypothetical protein
LIVSIGDSLAAGEGAPDVLQQFDGLGFVRRGLLWKDRHRRVRDVHGDLPPRRLGFHATPSRPF